MKNQAFINWNNGPNGPFHTSRHLLVLKPNGLYTRIFSRLYKIQVNAEGTFFVRKGGKKHSTILIS